MISTTFIIFLFVSLGNAQQCSTPQTLYTCYISYLGKYGVVPDDGYLPPSEFILNQMMTHGLPVICKDFEELVSCLGTASTYCVNLNVFVAYTTGRHPDREALAYLQNHAFFEFACGSGRDLFMNNLDCIQRSFQQIPLTNRMQQCGQSSLAINEDSCPSTLQVTDCVRQQMNEACGPSAGAAACGAATNIERRLDFLDAACLTEMDARCSVCQLKILTSIIILFIHRLIFT
ncbi:DUF19 domain-containing protein [Caenorhabditis elegans]|uniref:DUF19 domain-containing protein n=1 Tax=Caenorhabditis elegans TaxID=6239 RepID=Q9XVU6_CAEEL|nr:DUF19 domain-containing protein [Caenorhabditis elegans]CAB01246.1 DUF19 domain-containing protein [Caenorhabditis elegans]|eukprot:NP_506219.1 Uncharacterized protein CELE_T07F10.6 [Caenorhabditis elegans]